MKGNEDLGQKTVSFLLYHSLLGHLSPWKDMKTPSERTLKIWLAIDILTCVPFCLQSFVPLEECDSKLCISESTKPDGK